jgi:hypothetical protein
MWAEGHIALHQDWNAGDFSTEINKGYNQAFGVSFDFVALTDLVPAIHRAAAMQSISISDNPDWLSASELLLLAENSLGVNNAIAVILEHCRTGHLVAYARRMPLFEGGPLTPWTPLPSNGTSHSGSGAIFQESSLPSIGKRDALQDSGRSAEQCP